MKTQAAVLFSQPGKWEITELDLDEPKANEVLVRMVAAGLCHSDDHLATGDMAMSNAFADARGLPRQFPLIGAGPVRQHRPLRDALSAVHDGFLIDAGILVGSFELGQRVDVGAHFARKLPLVRAAFDTHDDALGIHRIHDPRPLAEHHGA